MSYRPLAVILLIQLVVTAQAQTNSEKNYFKKIEELSARMFDRPESTRKELLQLYENNPLLSDSLKAYTFFSIATCLGIMNQFDSGIVWVNKGIPLAPNNQRKTLALKNLGNLLYLKNEYDSAEKVFQTALEISRKTNDKTSESIILGSLSSFYTNQFKFEKALRYLLMAEKVLDMNAVADVVGKINLRSKMATIYYWMQNYRETIKIESELLPQMLQHNLYSNYASACAEIGDCYIHLMEFKKADEFLDKALNTYLKLNNVEYQGYVEMLQAKNCLKKSDYRKGLQMAEKSYKKLLSQASFYIVDITTIYLNLLANQGDIMAGKALLENLVFQETLKKVIPIKKLEAEQAALPFLKNTLSHKDFVKKLDQIQWLQDSIAALDRSRLILDIQEKYEAQLMEQEIDHLKESKKSQLLLFSGVTLVCMFILVLILIRYRFKNLLTDQQLIQEKQQYEHLLKKAKWEEQEKLLKEEIILQQKQELLRTSDEIKQLEIKLLELIEKKEVVTNENLIREFKKIKDDRQLLDNFMGNFNLILPNFTKVLKLQHATLTTADLQFCALIRMNLTYKEIASLLNIELTSVYRKKYRLEEKMGIKEEEIELYLQKF